MNAHLSTGKIVFEAFWEGGSLGEARRTEEEELEDEEPKEEEWRPSAVSVPLAIAIETPAVDAAAAEHRLALLQRCSLALSSPPSNGRW
eukprot:CAMPEP_0114538548 /NCGR_PEP_ID=MMETSP0109-20121206/30204_1 /TAXON_ID=29199 /ORGANISM="Chlorarachnion reptans, Strain CCCM449" /LENGTH=88 /DNA_ID=CAMNT_0001722579 /DNA_START=1206 /DNA_END=1473 /DNA_ORIENTATION=+